MSRIILIGCILASLSAYAQKNRTRYVAWVTPVGNNYVTIDGLALGLMAMPNTEGHLRINGLNVELLPLSVFTFFGGTINTMVNAGLGLDELYAEESEKIRTEIYGVSLSAGMFEDVEMHGLSINLVNSYVSISEGLEVSLIMNSNYSFNGVQAAMMGNRAVKGKGFQLGLFNSCDDCQVVQIGFLNRIGKRVLPIMNLRLKKKRKEATSS